MRISTPDRDIVRIYAFAWVLGYLAVYFVFRGLLPEKALVDAAYIQEVIQGLNKGGAPSQGYAFMVEVFSLLPQPVVMALVGCLNAFFLYRIVMCLGTFRGMLLAPLVLVPFIALNLQAPTKETLVVLMAFLLWKYALGARSESKSVVVITVVYALYGLMVRDYYLLILGVFLWFYVMIKSPILLRAVYVLPLIAAMLVMPEKGYMLLGNARNEVNFLVDFGSSSEVRTYFLNPFPSDNMAHFIGNYLYAFIMLNFPFLKAITAKEAVLFANVAVYGALMVVGLRRLQGPQRLLPLLFLSHVAVLTIFEPDYGSYFRHFSSVLFYLASPLIYLESRRAEFLRARVAEA